MDPESEFAFIFSAVLVGLVIIPALCGAIVASWRRSGRTMPAPTMLICLAPVVLFWLAHAAGISFVHSQAGVLAFVGTYAVYCLGTFALVWTRQGFPSLAGGFLALPIVGGVALGTVGILGLGLSLTEFVPRRSGTLNDRHRWAVTYYGNAISSDSGAMIEIQRRLPLVSFLERRIFTGRYDSHQIDLESVTARFDPNGGEAVIETSGQILARVPLR